MQALRDFNRRASRAQAHPSGFRGGSSRLTVIGAGAALAVIAAVAAAIVLPDRATPTPASSPSNTAIATASSPPPLATDPSAATTPDASVPPALPTPSIRRTPPPLEVLPEPPAEEPDWMAVVRRWDVALANASADPGAAAEIAAWPQEIRGPRIVEALTRDPARASARFLVALWAPAGTGRAAQDGAMALGQSLMARGSADRDSDGLLAFAIGAAAAEGDPARLAPWASHITDPGALATLAVSLPSPATSDAWLAEWAALSPAAGDAARAAWIGGRADAKPAPPAWRWTEVAAALLDPPAPKSGMLTEAALFDVAPAAEASAFVLARLEGAAATASRAEGWTAAVDLADASSRARLLARFDRLPARTRARLLERLAAVDGNAADVAERFVRSLASEDEAERAAAIRYMPTSLAGAAARVRGVLAPGAAAGELERLAAITRVPDLLPEEAFEFLLSATVAGADPAVRRAAIAALARVPDERVPGELLKHAESTASDLQRDAIAALGRCGGDAERERLTALLERTKSPATRNAIEAALREIGARK